ncbi:PiggyBac transposable element-derived protein 4, partial [Stegodyphus mimosarum]
MQRLRDLLETVESDEDCISEIESDTDIEIFSEHNTDTEEDDELDNTKDDDDSDDFVGKDGKTVWKKKKFRQNVRVRSHNIMTHLPGPVREARNVTDPFSSWNILIDNSILSIIVECTNLYISEIVLHYKRERDAKPTDVVEIKAVIGLLYLCGLHKSSHLNVKDLWATDGTGIEIFHTTMPYKRFLFLLRCMRFDKLLDRPQRKLFDKLAAIRDFFEKFISNCKDSYNLGEYVTIDEKLEPFRGRCGFRQYMPNKPAKYGIKIFALVDSRTFYTSNMEIYCGTQPDGPFKVSTSPSDVVKRLIQPLHKSSRNITTDNWYTSYPLAADLLKEKLTLVGTMRKNKREIPPTFVTSKGREIFSTLFGFEKDKTLISYVPKKGKTVLMLSTLHNDDAIDDTTGEKKKPEMICFYNMTKGAVDTVDEMAASYSVARITRRWPMVIFFSALNIAAINARIILLSTANPPTRYRSRRLFLKDLALELIKNRIEQRSDINTLARNLRTACKRRAEVSTNNSNESMKLEITKYKRCGECPRAKDRKTQMRYQYQMISQYLDKQFSIT